ncbi:YjeF N-terminal domain-containing protein [Blakeslea trispora]|nr:YjeF N-terminal domain-containing protein [Blakeslea trispora]
MGDESDTDSQTPEKYTKRQVFQKPLIKTTRRILTTAGVICPTLTPLQMAQVESEGCQVSSMFEGLSLEGAGRGTALLVLQLLSNKHRSVTILAGHGKKGAIGLVAARHLVHRGCAVTVCMPQQEQKALELVKQLGVTVCHDLATLRKRPGELMVDGLVGIDEPQTNKDLYPLIDWAKRQTNILSIDFPTGVNADTGHAYSSHAIRPRYTLCLNAPKTGCRSPEITGDLYLIDTGLPRLCWKRVGIKGNTIPWGADFLVALRYDT